MNQVRRATIAALAMMATGAGAAYFKPSATSFAPSDGFDLQRAVPKQFGAWQHEPDAGLALVDPQTKQLLDKIYSQMLTRVYRDPSGYRVMLSIAYGSDQRGALQAHKPEVCYPAQGFVLLDSVPAQILTPQGGLNVQRVRTEYGSRKEPITYWFTVGNQAVLTPLERRIAELKSLLTGRIPDGLLFRVSSIDPDSKIAFDKQQDFVLQLLSAVPADARGRLAGL